MKDIHASPSSTSATFFTPGEPDKGSFSPNWGGQTFASEPSYFQWWKEKIAELQSRLEKQQEKLKVRLQVDRQGSKDFNTAEKIEEHLKTLHKRVVESKKLQEEQLKVQIQNQTLKLEKELQNRDRKLKKMREKAQQNLSDQFESLQSQYKAQTTNLTKLKKQISHRMNKNVQDVDKQIKQIQKDKKTSQKKIFEKLDSLRCRLLNELDSEEAKRKQCNQIICKMLNKTCEKAETSIRRRIR